MTQKIEKKDVEKLAALARITIPENEIEKVRADMEVILAYVSQINEANDLVAAGSVHGTSFDLPPKQQHNFGVKNVMREDGQPHETGIYTEKILASAPNTEKGYIKVKKIL